MRWSKLLLVCFASLGTASAQEGPVRLHFEPGAVFTFNTPENDFEVGGTGALKLELPVLGSRKISPQVEAFGLFYNDPALLQRGVGGGVGIGARLKFLESPVQVHAGGRDDTKGNLFGNAWIDAHPLLTYAAGGLGVGFDAATGVALNVVPGVQAGPYVKFMLMDGSTHWIGGISISWISKGPSPVEPVPVPR